MQRVVFIVFALRSKWFSCSCESWLTLSEILAPASKRSFTVARCPDHEAPQSAVKPF